VFVFAALFERLSCCAWYWCCFHRKKWAFELYCFFSNQLMLWLLVWVRLCWDVSPFSIYLHKFAWLFLSKF